MTMYLKDILKGVICKTSEKIARVAIRNIVDDSRKVSRGDLFVAVRGYMQDGSKFINSALSNGAKAIVTETDFDAPKGVVKVLAADTRQAISVIADNYYGHPSGKLRTVGITGTNGKTTITYIIEGIIKAAGRRAGVIGTINYRLKGKILPAKNTTPGPIELQGMLNEMVRSKIGYAVMEVSSHSLDQGRVEKILFDVGIFTNITGDHLDYHKTAVNYYKAKKRLFDKLKNNGTAVLNSDDKKVAALARSIRGRVITYGVKSKADITADDIRLSMEGTSFSMKTPERCFTIRTKLIGIHNVSNILAAAAAALALKIPAAAIIKGIESVGFVPGRLEVVDAGQSFKVFVDFAHTEDALFNVLTLLRKVARRRIVTVFGCGGNRDKTKRPLMGKVACRYSDHVIITSDNPRFEEPRAIIDEIESGIKARFSNYDIVVDRKEAIGKAFARASKDDIVVIAGKGHESCQIIKDTVMPFDDRETARRLLRTKYES